MQALFELAAGAALMAIAAGLIAAAASALGLPPWLVAVLERSALR
jgi:predicted nicotinamide N-methyase